MRVETTLLILYVLVGPCFWGFLVYGIFAARSRMNRLAGPPPPLPEPCPSVTIVVPAKDEAGHIETCVQRLLDQDFPRLAVHVIDDRSTDDTGSILDRMARERAPGQGPALTVLHVDHLPDAWLGKCNALHTGTRDLGSDWLLFVDSDVAIDPSALRTTLGVAVQRGYDAVSILTRLDGRTFWERLMIPVCGAAWATMFLISWTNDDHRSSNAVANGQFFLIRRDLYERVGGHASVKQEIVEDVELMRRLKTAGARCRLFVGSHLAATQMHATLAQLRSGWGRIFAGTARYRRARLAGATVMLLFGGLSVYPMLGVGLVRWFMGGGTGWLIAAGAHWCLMTGFLLYVYRAARSWPWHALAPFVSFPVLIGLLWEGLRRCGDRRFEWRGVSYSLSR